MKLRLTAFAGKPNDEQWNEKFQLLQYYLKDNNNSYPTAASGSLGMWLHNQRKEYKKKTLSPVTKPPWLVAESARRRTLLESLPGWSWNPRTDKWNENFQLLQDYLKDNSYPTAASGPLGEWLHDQRQAYKKETITKDRIRRLESLPSWSWAPITDKWNATFEKWKKYIVEHNGRPNRGPLQGWAVKIRAIGAETYKTHYRDRYDKLINYVEDPEFVGLIGKPKNIPKESLEWTWEINKIPKHWLVGKESEKIIFELFTKNGIFKNPDICKIYNRGATGCDFVNYHKKTLTFFEIKTTGLLDDQKNAIPNFDSLTSYQEKLRDLILDRSSLFKEGLTKLELEGVKKNFLDTAVLEGLKLKRLLDPETGTHKDYESLKYCVIFCSFFEDPKDSGKYQIKFPATGYYEDSNIQRPHGLDEHILEVPLETLDIIKKNQRVTAKLRIGRWIKQ